MEKIELMQERPKPQFLFKEARTAGKTAVLYERPGDRIRRTVIFSTESGDGAGRKGGTDRSQRYRQDDPVKKHSGNDQTVGWVCLRGKGGEGGRLHVDAAIGEEFEADAEWRCCICRKRRIQSAICLFAVGQAKRRRRPRQPGIFLPPITTV